MRRASPVPRRNAAALLLPLATGCGGGERLPLDGEYLRAAFHLAVACEDDPDELHTRDLLYPVNVEGQTFRFEESRGQVRVTWAGRQVAFGERLGDVVSLRFLRPDPFSAPVDWRFRGRIRDDLRFHERTLVGTIVSGRYHDPEHGECDISPSSVAWFTTRPRDLGATLDPAKDAEAAGDWTRFVWFLDIGPLPMVPKGGLGPRGQSLRLFSLASTGGGRITTGDDAAFVDNGFETAPFPGSAQGSSVVFEQAEYAWHLVFSQDVVWERPASDDPGIRRVLAGFVTGSVRVAEESYPNGFDGPVGMVELVNPGMAFWLDVEDRAAAGSVRHSAITIAAAGGADDTLTLGSPSSTSPACLFASTSPATASPCSR